MRIFYSFLAVISFTLLSGNILPPNDGPCNAENLGVLPLPPFCPNVAFGDSVLVQGSTVSATAEPLSYALLNCSGGGNINPGSPDVWYKFTATGKRLTIKVFGSGGQIMSQPGVSVFNSNGGKCLNLLPIHCQVGVAGVVVAAVNGLVPGMEYFIQVRGCASVTDKGNFNLIVKNGNECAICTQDTYLGMTPMPVNGYYPPSTPVTFFYAMRGYKSVQGNYLKAVKINFTNVWDTSGISASALPANPASGHGNWKWSSAYGGFLYDENSNGNFNDDGGDTSTTASIWVFAVTVSTKPCGGATANNLDFDIRNISDGDYYGTGLGCNLDPLTNFKSVLNCCALSLPYPQGTSCFSTCNGQVQVYGSTTNFQSYPLQVQFYDPFGQFEGSGSITGLGSNYTKTGLCRKGYNIFVKDTVSGCIEARHINIDGPFGYFPLQTGVGCAPACANSAQLILFGAATGYQFIWDDSQGNTYNGSSVSGLCSGLHTITFDDAGSCPDYVDSLFIFSIPGSNVNVVYPPEVCNQAGTQVTPYNGNPGGVFSSPSGLSHDSISGTVYIQGTTLPGSYQMVYTTPAPCFTSDTFAINIVTNFDAAFNYPGSNFCKTIYDTVSPLAVHPMGYYSYNVISPAGATITLDSISGKVNVDFTMAGTYEIVHVINDPYCPGTYSDTIVITETCDSILPVTEVEIAYNSITPNNDGFNDKWVIPGIENEKNRVMIFNRYGAKVYEVSNYDNTTKFWDGTGSDGRRLPAGTYYYIVQLTEKEKQFKAWIELLD